MRAGGEVRLEVTGWEWGATWERCSKRSASSLKLSLCKSSSPNALLAPPPELDLLRVCTAVEAQEEEESESNNVG